MLQDVNEDGVYRLAVAVVRGLDDPAEIAAWREVGETIRERMGYQPALRTTGGVRTGHMTPVWVDDGRSRTRGRASSSARISARK